METTQSVDYYYKKPDGALRQLNDISSTAQQVIQDTITYITEHESGGKVVLAVIKGGANAKATNPSS